MKKILLINTVEFGKNGITAVIMNYLNNMNREDIIFDLVTINKLNNEYKHDNLCNINQVYELTAKKKHLFQYLFNLAKIVKENRYEIVHVHGNSSMMIFELFICKLLGIKVRIAHCHNNNCDHPLINNLLKNFFYKTYTLAFACSKLAGNWLYGKHPYIILNNAIDTEKYKFSYQKREQIRKDLGIDNDTIVIGHVGLFNEQKNQEFLINLICNIQNKDNYKLMLIGTGPLLSNLKNMVADLNMREYVLFLGEVDNVNAYLSTMDIFAFPSKWEGFGIALLEAQASGLYCITSDKVSREVNVSKSIIYSGIDTTDNWINNIYSFSINLCNRSKVSNMNILKIKNAKLDIKKEAEFLRKIYMGEAIR